MKNTLLVIKRKAARLNQASYCPERFVCLREHMHLGCIRADKIIKHCLSFDLQPSGDPGLTVILHRNGMWALWITAVLTSQNHLEQTNQTRTVTPACKVDIYSWLTPRRITRSIKGHWLEVSYTFSGPAKLGWITFLQQKYPLCPWTTSSYSEKD